jgi:hypothetical protein
MDQGEKSAELTSSPLVATDLEPKTKPAFRPVDESLCDLVGTDKDAA